MGLFDPETRSVDKHPARAAGDVDLLDLPAIYTITYGGTVFGVHSEEISGGGTMAARFRY